MKATIPAPRQSVQIQYVSKSGESRFVECSPAKVADESKTITFFGGKITSVTTLSH